MACGNPQLSNQTTPAPVRQSPATATPTTASHPPLAH